MWKGAAGMEWVALVVVAVLLACAIPALVIRFNQLSLNRSLCKEARRQFDGARATRHGVMSVFLPEAARLLGPGDDAAAALEASVVSAHRVLPRADAGAAEHTVSDATRAVAARLREKGLLRGWIADLYAQLEENETHIGAAVRHHNASIRAYMRRRRGLVSLPFRGLHPRLQEIDYMPSPVAEDPIAGEPSPGAEGYRPGRVTEDT